MRGTSTVRIPHGLLSTLPSEYLSMICALAVAVYMYIVLSYALLFVYRFAVLNSNSLIATILTGKNVLIFFGAIVIVCAIEMALVHLSSVDTLYLWDKLNRTSDVADDFLYQLEFNRQTVILAPTTVSPEVAQTKVPTVAPAVASGMHQLDNAKIVINVFGSDYKRNPMVFFSSGLLVAMNIVAYIIIFICAYYILKSLTRKQEQMSKETRGVHEVLIKILFLESVFPLIFVIPPFVFYVLTLFDLDFRYPRDMDEYITTICIIMIPAVPPMLTFIFVDVYKKAIIHLLTCSFLRRTTHDNIAENATEDQGPNDAPEEHVNRKELSHLICMTAQVAMLPNSFLFSPRPLSRRS
uniref:G protein-coupled receptor n=1 Tax=Steinernema glaseri TaxID=37863 RepID=A0A1I8A252_9BILA